MLSMHNAEHLMQSRLPPPTWTGCCMYLDVCFGVQGEQVFITYGQQSNDKLLQYYGFVEPKNPADAYVVPNVLDALRGLPYVHISEERVQSVQQAGLLTSLEQVCAQQLSCCHICFVVMQHCQLGICVVWPDSRRARVYCLARVMTDQLTKMVCAQQKSSDQS